MTDPTLKLFDEPEIPFVAQPTDTGRERVYNRSLTINTDSDVSSYLKILEMPLDLASVVMCIVLLILTYLTVHLVLILAAYLVWPITIAVFVLLLLPMLRDGTVQSALPSVAQFFNNLTKKTSSVALNVSDYYGEIRKSFSGRGDYFQRAPTVHAETPYEQFN